MEVKHELRLVRSVVRIKIGMSTLPSVVRKKVSEEAELERKRRRKNRGLLVILSSSLPVRSSWSLPLYLQRFGIHSIL